MNEFEKSLREYYKNLINDCVSVGATVKIKRIKHEYYIHIDMTKNQFQIDWKSMWGGFDAFILSILYKPFSPIKYKNLIFKNDLYIIVQVGSLVDFLTTYNNT